jgi:hypothetical protein
MVVYDEIDIRLAVGEPQGDGPIKTICPVHEERLGEEDDTGSLAIYRDGHIHCFGCFFHLRRRYSSLAFLLGEWDGRGSENGPEASAAVRRIKARLPEFVNGRSNQSQFVPPPPDPYAVEAFHHYLLRRPDRLRELRRMRGLTLETIQAFRLGYTGTHFTIPVPSVAGGIYTIRYRTDDSIADRNEPGYRKYEGSWGRNLPMVYPLSVLGGIHAVEELWITEGEFDALVNNQAGNMTLTVTNGSGSLARLPEMLFDQFPNLTVNRVVIATDLDAAGEEAAEKLSVGFAAYGVPSVRARWSPGKDLGEYYASGGSREEIMYMNRKREVVYAS